MNLLIVEDEVELSKSIQQYLSDNNFICETEGSFATALNRIKYSEFDCVILDLTLPDGNGLHLLKKMKELNKSEGVLIISAKNSLEDKINGLEIGADDYLTKPFHLAELSARVNAIIRRKSFEGNNTLVVDNLAINILNKSVEFGTNSIELTRKEYELLIFFISNKNRVLTKESIIDHLWGDHSNVSDTYDIIYSHIKNLRKKLSEKGCPDYIKAVYGMGYKFSVS